jgi:hypothetical protein
MKHFAIEKVLEVFCQKDQTTHYKMFVVLRNFITNTKQQWTQCLLTKEQQSQGLRISAATHDVANRPSHITLLFYTTNLYLK